MIGDLWARGCERLAAELPEQQFNTWIRPLPSGSVTDQGEDGAVVLLRVPNRFKLDWIRNQYAGRIEAVLSEIAGKPVRLEIALAPRDGNGSMAGASPGTGFGAGPMPVIKALAGLRPGAGGDASGKPGRIDGQGNATSPAPGGIGAMRGAAMPLPSRTRLNPLLTFETLVPGRANQMARTAALHVAGAPGEIGRAHV